MTEETKDPFDVAFEEVAHQAERTPEEVKADEAVQAEAARKAAEAARTPEQIAADAKAVEEAAATAAAEAKKVEDAAAAAALAAEKPEEKAAREVAEAKAAEEAAAASTAKAKADAEAAEAARVAAAAAAKETPEQIAAREALEASIKPYEPTDAEKAALVTFEKEFPNEFVAMQARLKGVDKDINARVYAAVQGVLKQVAPRVAAVEATVATSEVDRHFAALRTAHSDYDAVIAKVPAWIKTLPSYAQAGAQAVYDGGSTTEVAALVADYKNAAGVTTTTTPAPAKGAAKGADDLAPVNTRRTTTQQNGAPDKNDMDGAWAELAEVEKASIAAR